MKGQQQGFALFVSMILLVILTLIGFSIANKGKLSAQVTRTGSRYETVSAAAEAEMYRIAQLLSNTEQVIKTGNGMVCTPAASCNPSANPQRIRQIWSNSALGAVFNSGIMPDFKDLSNTTQWDRGIHNTVRSQYGQIQTRLFVQELTSHETVSAAGEMQIEYDYLITVKAAALYPGDKNEKETIVLQSLYSLHFII